MNPASRVALTLWFLFPFHTGMIGSAAASDLSMSLDGANDYAYSPDNPSLRLGVGATQSFTIELSFYLAQTNPVGYRLLVFKDRAYELGIEFRTNYSQTWIHFDLWRTTNNFDRVTTLTSIGTLKPGRHHIAAVFKNTPTQDLRMVFLDGLVAGRNQSDSFASGIAASTNRLCIGGAGGTNSFPGWIDEMRFSDSIRYTNENYPGFNVPYQVPPSPFMPDANTVALWHFDETPGTTIFLDASGHGNHLTATNGAVTGEAPRVQNAGSLDLTFNPGLGIGSDISPSGIYSIALQTNGQIIIGGFFMSVDGLPRTNLARLNPDGSVDPSFNVTFARSFGSAEVRSVVVLSNNQVLVGGSFDQINGTNRTGLARLNPDGSLDSTFNPVVSFAQIKTIVVQPDGKILIGGFFSSVNGVSRNEAARLNANGSLDASFDPGMNLSTPEFDKMLVHPDGGILCDVNFYSFSLGAYSNVVRLNANGSRDASFQPALSQNFPADALALQPDGQILIVGAFTNVNGVPRPGVARLNSNGTLDPSFDLTNSQPSYYTNGGWLDFAAVQRDGKVLLSSLFFIAPNTTDAQIARFLTNGALDPTFQPAEFYRPNSTVHDLIYRPDSKLLIAGEFTDVNGYSRSGIARLYGDPILPPRFVSITRQPSGAMQILLANPALRSVTLQAITNLQSLEWTALATNATLSNRLDFLDSTAASFRRRFYRALLNQP